MTFVLVKNMLIMKLWDKFIPKKREIRLYFLVSNTVLFLIVSILVFRLIRFCLIE